MRVVVNIIFFLNMLVDIKMYALFLKVVPICWFGIGVFNNIMTTSYTLNRAKEMHNVVIFLFKIIWPLFSVLFRF